MAIDFQDLMLEVSAAVQEIVQETMTELMEPQMVNAMRMKWMVTPDEMKELLKQTQPQTYRKLMEMIQE